MTTEPAGSASVTSGMSAPSMPSAKGALGSKTCVPGLSWSAPWLAAVSSSATCSDAESDEHETTPGATSRWKACSFAPGRVTMKPDSISGSGSSLPPPNAVWRKGPMRATMASSAPFASHTGSAL
eukprot:scaffold5052_cov30-Tisochrysis_lutea.AAC.3